MPNKRTKPVTAAPAAAPAQEGKPAPAPGRGETRTPKEGRAKDREALLAYQARLEAELAEIESRTARAGDGERATDLASHDDHPADLASETYEREKDLAVGESVQGLLDQVRTALEKVERGTYGLCDACGSPIKRARLQALPSATLCVECQGRLER